MQAELTNLWMFCESIAQMGFLTGFFLAVAAALLCEFWERENVEVVEYEEVKAERKAA
jgi:hypothetical protein